MWITSEILSSISESSYHAYEVGTCVELTEKETEALPWCTSASQTAERGFIQSGLRESIYPKSWLSDTPIPIKYFLNEWMAGLDTVFQSDIDHQLIAFQYSSKWIFKPCAIHETPVVLCTYNKDTASVFCFSLLPYETQILSFSVLFMSEHLLVYFLLHTV